MDLDHCLDYFIDRYIFHLAIPILLCCRGFRRISQIILVHLKDACIS